MDNARHLIQYDAENRPILKAEEIYWISKGV